MHGDYNVALQQFETDPDRYHAIRSFISFKGNIICTRRKAFGKMTAITS